MADQDFEAARAELRSALVELLAGQLADIKSAITEALNAHDDRPRLSLVRNTDTGDIYAYGPGQFDRISSMDELEYGRGIGLYTRAGWLDTDTAGIAVFRGLSLEGSAAGQ